MYAVIYLIWKYSVTIINAIKLYNLSSACLFIYLLKYIYTGCMCIRKDVILKICALLVVYIYMFKSYLNHLLSSRVLSVNPLSPHDALKHHFTSLKTDLIFIQLGVFNRKFQ